MAKFVLTYSGGSGMPETEAEQAQVMETWGAWFGQLGDAVVDGGNPFAGSKVVAADGSVSDGGNLGGYSILSADGMDAAVAMAQGCPVLSGGGSVEVSEAVDM